MAQPEAKRFFQRTDQRLASGTSFTRAAEHNRDQLHTAEGLAPSASEARKVVWHRHSCLCPDHSCEGNKNTDSVCTTKVNSFFFGKIFWRIQDLLESSGWLPRNSGGADPSPARKQFNQDSCMVMRGFRVLCSEGKGLSLNPVVFSDKTGQPDKRLA